MADFEVWLSDSEGVRLEYLDLIKDLRYTRTVDGVGSIEVSLPYMLSGELLRVDNLITVYYRPIGGVKRWEGTFFLRDWERGFADGQWMTTLVGPDLGDLLDRRYCLYKPGTPVTYGKVLNTPADDGMKRLIRVNFGPNTYTYSYPTLTYDPTRDISGLGFSVAEDVSLGPVIPEVQWYWRPVRECLEEHRAKAEELGTPVHYGIVARREYPIDWQFETRVGLWGSDRTLGCEGSPLLFGPDYDNVGEAKGKHDWLAEYNYVAALGVRAGAMQTVGFAENERRSRVSQWARREKVIKADRCESVGQAEQAARRELQAGRPRRIYGGELVPAEGAVYGVDFDLGDRLPVRFGDEMITTELRQLAMTLQSDGRVAIVGKLELEETD